ncbi:heat shock 70 kDa protein-like [Paramacrobiotus metropolitanus]|uniref:heat shock 70 kDa protein-like n=1 Tax=Paramacrobiotus metropolitanus TaxID=2943436 RepID=UPI002446082C|nr:heat shock 70 kDa protein-like [Paramacrobiotus metropolitanus]
MTAPEQIPIGIDLGTSYSCVAAYRDGRAEAIPNDQGNRITPSVVGFHEGERLVGEGAVTQWQFHPKNTICDSKRMIGRSFDDQLVQHDIPNWSFQVVNENDKPHIVVEEDGQASLITPEQVSAMVLAKMKETAEASLEAQIFDVVITVPAYFTDAQRQATKDAAAIAGLNVLRMVNEPTAAAICHGMEKKYKKAQKILVFDLGGGTLDVSILIAEPNMKFTVMTTHGDPHLGGKDFDNAITNYLAKEYEQQNNMTFADAPEALQGLRQAVEAAKKTLSFSQQAKMAIPNFLSNDHYKRTITREEWETVCKDLFDRILIPVDAAIKDANLTVADIEDVVLVGGSSRIPKVKEVLQQFFSGKQLLHSAHPDESVARGAAIYAAKLMGDKTGNAQSLALVDVTPFTLGIEIHGGDMKVFFPKNTRLPAQTSDIFTTVYDNQESVKVQIFEGEADVAKDNRLLGEVVLSGIEPALRGTPQIMVTFDIDASGILNVSAVNRKDGNKVEATIDNDKYNLSLAEIQRIADSLTEGTPDEELKAQEKVLWNRLTEYKNSVAQTLAKYKQKLSSQELQRANESLKELDEWMASHPEANKAVIISKHQEANRNFRAVMLLLVA